jgi:hypothetical protein
MNFLAGPLTRQQIPALNVLADALAAQTGASLPSAPAWPAVQPVAEAVQSAPSSAGFPGALQATSTRPAVPTGVAEYFLPNNLTFTQAFKAAGRSYPSEAASQGLIYRPVLLAQASVRFLNRKYNLDHEARSTCLVPAPDRRGVVRWENFDAEPVDLSGLDEHPDPQARFAALEAPLNEAKRMISLQKDFLDWVYRSSQVTVRANEALKVFTGPDVSQAELRRMVVEAARTAQEAELSKIADSFDKKLATLQDRLDREGRELSEDQTELSQRKMEEMGTHAENVFSLFTGRRSSRRLSSSLSKRRMTEQSKAEVDESLDSISDLKKAISQLEKEKAEALEEVQARWQETAARLTEIAVPALKKDVSLDLFGVAWFPYHLVQVSAELVELPGYGNLLVLGKESGNVFGSTDSEGQRS